MRRFAILRAAKLKTTAKLKAVSAHNLRRGTVENADEKRADRNLFARFDPDKMTWMRGSAEGLPDLDAIVEQRVASIEARGGKVRSNAVRAIELVMTASPEAFTQPGFKLNRWIGESLKWVGREFGLQNIVQAAVHLDEQTPHMHVVVIPETMMRETRGRRPKSVGKAAASPEKPTLAAHKWLDGAAALAAMQDRYADAMAQFGLERGVKGTRTKHKTVRAFYGAAEQVERQAEPLQRQIAAAVDALPAPALVNTPAAVKAARKRQEELAAAATAAAEQARQAERAALLLRMQLETAQAQLDALGGKPAIEQIEALRAELQRQGEQQQIERERLQQAVAELRAERDAAVRSRESLRAEMQADIEHWRQHAGALDDKIEELRQWGRSYKARVEELETELYGPEDTGQSFRM
jgi:hypothetical protein